MQNVGSEVSRRLLTRSPLLERICIRRRSGGRMRLEFLLNPLQIFAIRKCCLEFVWRIVSHYPSASRNGGTQALLSWFGSVSTVQLIVQTKLFRLNFRQPF